MYNQIPKPKPYVIMLKKMDFWYWCRYYIDIYKTCPYNCSYCETRSLNTSALKGIEIVPGLPEEKDTIGLGLLSDIYNPVKEENIIIKSLLEFLYEKGYSVNIVTKSENITNDLDILKKFAKQDRIRVTFTLLTLDKDISYKLEGKYLDPEKRLNSLKILSDSNIPTGVAITPIIPYVNDKKEMLKSLITEIKNSGAGWVLFSGFNPVQNFLNIDTWKNVRNLFDNQEQLNLRYKRAKQLILSLLLKENLPIRIPRINLYKNTNRYYIKKVAEYLYNISYLYELLENRLESIRFRRASIEIEKIGVSIKSLIIQNKLGYIRGINPEIENVIKEIIYTDKSSLYNTLLKKLTNEFIV